MRRLHNIYIYIYTYTQTYNTSAQIFLTHISYVSIYLCLFHYISDKITTFKYILFKCIINIQRILNYNTLTLALSAFKYLFSFKYLQIKYMILYENASLIKCGHL